MCYSGHIRINQTLELRGSFQRHLMKIVIVKTMKYTFVKQHDATDCAAACLAIAVRRRTEPGNGSLYGQFGNID